MAIEAKQTRADAMRMVAAILCDGRRSDRILRKSDDGTYYTATNPEVVGTGIERTPPHALPYVRIPAATEGAEGDDDIQDWALAILAEMDEIAGEDA